MVITPDPITHRKLTLVKSIYRHAASHSEGRHSLLARMLAVSTFDLAIETALKTVLRALDSSRVPPSDLNALIQLCDDRLQKAGLDPVPDKANVNQVRSYRNAVQHEARYPNDSEVSDCRIYTRDFLDKLIPYVWGISLEAVYQSSLVQHEQTRSMLVVAEQKLAVGDYSEAAKQAGLALSFALRAVRDGLGLGPSAWSMQIDGIALRPRMPGVDISYIERDTYLKFRRMQDTLVFLALGMNYADYIRCRAITGSTIIVDNRRAELYPDMSSDISFGDAEFIVSFSLDTILRIEEILGDIEKPASVFMW